MDHILSILLVLFLGASQTLQSHGAAPPQDLTIVPPNGEGDVPGNAKITTNEELHNQTLHSRSNETDGNGSVVKDEFNVPKYNSSDGEVIVKDLEKNLLDVKEVKNNTLPHLGNESDLSTNTSKDSPTTVVHEPLILNAEDDHLKNSSEPQSAPRGDTSPVDFTKTGEKDLNSHTDDGKQDDETHFPSHLDDGNQGDETYSNSSTIASSEPVFGAVTTFNTMSWLDAFMYEHRGSMWVLFNTFFMVIWIIIGCFSLYRLFGLPWCSPYVSRTQYLVIHLLIFTGATFEFVQLIHLSYGSQEGLPLFLTLLLTQTPSPCLAVGVILMTYCVYASTRVPVFGSYLPPLIYVSILVSSIIVFGFVGDIIVGVSRNSVFLIVIRVFITLLCLFCLLAYIFNYRKIVAVALLLRREFRGELKSLAIPVDSHEESHDGRFLLKKILLTWARLTLVGCVSGVLMCIFSFCLSLFFTVSFVPLWAFWVLHSCIFVSQVVVVITITLGAAYTLNYTTNRSMFYVYFFPSSSNVAPPEGSFIKRGNFIYQRVSVVNGPTVPQIVAPTVIDNDERLPLRNNNIITELSTPPFRNRVNLKRSATFNCAPPYGFHGVHGIPSPNLYPVLSDHALPYSNSQTNIDFNRHDVNDLAYTEAYHKPSIQLSNSFNHGTERGECQRYNYGRRYPMRSFQCQDRMNSLANNYPHRRSFAQAPGPPGPPGPPGLPGLAGTVEPLSVAVGSKPMAVENTNPAPSPGFLRQIPHNHSFSSADRGRVPEKPARKTVEPILVKSVMKDNACLENAIPLQEAVETNTKKPYSYKDHNNYSKHNLREGNDNSCISPSVRAASQIPITDKGTGVKSTSIWDYPSKFRDTASPVTTSASPSLGVPEEGPGEVSYPKERDTLLIADAPIMSQQSETDAAGNEPSAPGTPTTPVSRDLSSSFESSTPRCSLKRNHSTAGDFSPEVQREDSHEGLPPEGSKYPWYGTWGGRRRSKKRDSVSDTSSVRLHRHSASKTSLSSLYDKLRPKKTKSLYQPPVETVPPTAVVNGIESEDSSIKSSPEEEELFLPRLDEDIDLAADIFKSSTVLADFYSLKRSDLKKRKAERNKSGEEVDKDGVEGSEVGDKKSDKGSTETLVSKDDRFSDSEKMPLKNVNDIT